MTKASPAGRARAGAGVVPKDGALVFTRAELERARVVVEVVAPVVPALAAALPGTEVVLHDLTRFPRTIAAIGGTLTGREVGGPPTDLGLRLMSAGWREHLIRYETEAPSGHTMRSSSIFLYAESGRPVACLCLNTDVDDLRRARDILQAMTATRELLGSGDGRRDKSYEKFPVSVKMLTEGIVRDAIAAIGVPVSLMKKSHKLRVVQELDGRGFFAIRDAVDLAAKRLDVSRFTIYNYLRQMQNEGNEGRSRSAVMRG